MIGTHPRQREIQARIFTNAGWLMGAFHLLESHSFDDFLEGSGPYFKLTNVTLPAGPATLEFFALRRGAAIVIVPQTDLSALLLPASRRPVETHQVACLLETGILLGKLDVLAGVRVSDYLANHKGFTELRDCKSVSGTPNINAPIAFVNSPQIIGVTERDSA